MKKGILGLTVLWLFVPLMICKAQVLQNMVQNPSFEVYKKMPADLGGLTGAAYWFNPTKSSPDFFHRRASGENVDVPRNKMGQAEPRTGHGYAGFYAYTSRYSKRDFREYLQVQLKQAMQPNERYCVKVHVYLSQSSNRALNSLGATFTRIQLEKDIETPIELPFFNLLRSDKRNIDGREWVELSGYYDAFGGERYLVFGNFHNDKETRITGAIEIDSFRNPNVDFAYYFVDDVCVTSLRSNFNCDCGSFEYDVNATREKIVLDIGLQQKTISVGQEIVMDSIDFEQGKAIFLSTAHNMLEDLTAILQMNSHYVIEISGHTDDTGDPEENQKLSTRRAKAVYDYLLSSGIAETRLSYRGYGQSRPIVLNDDAKGRAINERIQIKRLQ